MTLGDSRPMTELSRREALAAAALASLAAAVPAWAQTAAADPTTPLWDLSEIYPDDAAWDAARKDVLAAIPGIAKWQGRLGSSADALAEALVYQSDLGRTAGRVFVYASLKGDEDVRVAGYQEKLAQARDMFTAFGEAGAWIAPELLTVGREKIEGFIAANAVLKSRFDFFLRDALRQAEHTLSPEGEGLLASVGSPLGAPGQIASQLRSSDIPWPTVTLSTGQSVRLDSQGYTLYRDAPDRADRKLVFDAFWTEHGRFENSFGGTYAAKVKGDIFYAKARKYPTSLAFALSGNNIPEAVYRTLVAEAKQGAAPAPPLFRAAPQDPRPARPALLRHLSAAGAARPQLFARPDARDRARGGQAARRRLCRAHLEGDRWQMDGSLAARGQAAGRLYAARRL